MDRIEGLMAGAPGRLFKVLENEIAEAVDLYWNLAARILEGSGVTLLEIPRELRTLRRNFFSALFLYSYHRAGIPAPRRVLYAAVNHCLRGMVTGCDNILDDEYKPTLLTDLPENGHKFRSVLDIMVSDRILFHLLMDANGRGELPPGLVLQAVSGSLNALTRSGAQEAQEEGGIEEILPPETILASIHHFKTGLLFQSPWAVPLLMENGGRKAFAPLMEALYKIGMGCQVMDDMVDMGADVEKERHNYIASLVAFGPDDEERTRLLSARNTTEEDMAPGDFAAAFPLALETAAAKARDYLRDGLHELFPEELHSMVPPVIGILAQLIGAGRYMSEQDEAR